VRLEALGFEDVYDYPGGKSDWLAAGLPDEGEKAHEVRAGDLARSNPPTCPPDESVELLSARPDVRSWRLCVVTDAHQVVHGLVTAEDLASAGPRATAEEIMQLGPRTIRPSMSVERVLKTMDETGSEYLLVTTGFGELLGALMRADITKDP
jgi:CBS domain-containing protein